MLERLLGRRPVGMRDLVAEKAADRTMKKQ